MIKNIKKIKKDNKVDIRKCTLLIATFDIKKKLKKTNKVHKCIHEE